MQTNHRLSLAADFVSETGENIFLTGRAGTGKTTFLKALAEHSPKRMIVVAPTGVAAINAGGVTMHSFFQLPFGMYIPGTVREGEIRRFSKTKIAIIKSIDLVVIDEISMVRADLLDSVDDVLRRFRDRTRPFGGVQLLMIGDVQQLAPVVKEEEWEVLRRYYASPYFFDSLALRRSGYTTIELRQIYRQTDEDFIDLLARVRENRIDTQTLHNLNARHRPDFDPPQSEGYITLTSHNHTARRINDDRLAALPTPEFTYHCDIEGDFPENLYPVEARLRLKEGAQVMFTKNDTSPEKRFVNGTIGTVTRLDDDSIEVQPSSGGDAIAVPRVEWNNVRYTLDPTTNTVKEQIEGVFRQYPLRAAWAITIHKSQGLTFDRAIIDAAESFSHGQVYVALSRCRTLDGVVLKSPLRADSVVSDGVVDDFLRYIASNQPDTEALDASRKRYYESLLGELFDFDGLLKAWCSISYFMEEHLVRLYPMLVGRWREAGKALRSDVVSVGARFRTQIAHLMSEGYATDPTLAERVRKGADYFLEHCALLTPLPGEAAAISLDNKKTAGQFKGLMDSLGGELRVKLATLEAAQGSFTVSSYLGAKGAAIAEAEAGTKPAKRTDKSSEKPSEKPSGKADGTRAADIINPELFEILRQWRMAQATQQKRLAFQIASQKVLIGIAATLPATADELVDIKGVGPAFVKKYGTQVLAIVDEFKSGKIG